MARFFQHKLALCLLLAVAGAVCAPAAQAQDAPPATIFPHSESSRFWVSGQVNFISQWHPAFPARYSGRNSLSPGGQNAVSRVLTLNTGVRVSRSAELLCDVQETGGHGLGEALGIAGFTNLDVVRNPTLSKAPYVARLMWHQVIALGSEKTAAERTPLSLFRELPVRRLEVRFGKFGLADFFDLNSYGTDSNFQFMNWAVDNNGAYDYAADTRGYTFGAMLEYHERRWAVRFAEGLMPKVANGIHLDANLGRAHAENIEFEVHGALLPRRQGVLRLLSYVNHGNMGSYREAVNNFRAGLTSVPDITAHPRRTEIKYGFGVNFEQPLSTGPGSSGAGAGAKAATNPTPTPRWTRRPLPGWGETASAGGGVWTAQGSPSHPMGFRGTTSSTWPWEETGSSWETAG